MRNTNITSPQPLISFIITTYNLPKQLLVEAIESAMNLTLSKKEREIIVVDDGSDTIDTLKDIQEIANNIIYIRQANQGLSAARNTALRIAQGQYIQFIDGDDKLLRTPYEHCLDIMRYHNPDIVIFESTNKNSKTIPFNYNGPVTGAEYMRNNNVKASACSYLFKKNTLGSLQFPLNILHEDEEFTPQLLLRCERVFTTQAEAYFYRQRKGSIMHPTSKQKLTKSLNDTEQVIYHLQEISLNLPEEERVAIERRIAQLTMDYIYNMCKSHSSNEVEKAVERLSKHNLFPLPDKKYTKKYNLFRKATMTSWGRKTMSLLVKNSLLHN
jgi:glycosyltransferase involved in cell wall biosynthesis